MSTQEDTMMSTLYEASVGGDVRKLNTLIQQNPFILNKLSLTTFAETPLHISALLSHLDFSKTILSHKPQLAKELDSCRRTPLHLASAEGHKEIVHVLLQAYAAACLVEDQDGRIPVHYAAIRGRSEVVRDLIRAKPDSLRIPVKGNTLMHLCVTYNHLETLRVVVEGEGDESELLSFGDSEGRNTILHLAAMFKQVEAIRYMLSVPKIVETANNENDMGFTALDIIEHTPKDFKSLEIQLMLTDFCTKSKKNIQRDNHISVPPPSTTINVVPAVILNWLTKFKNWKKLFEYNAKWMEERRETLGLVATVISTMSFQVAINPPGGVYQEINEKWKEQQSLCTAYEIGGDSSSFCPGKAVLATLVPRKYNLFLIFNTISFVASVTVAILLLAGVPTKNRAVMWISIIGMCIAVASLLNAYYYGMWMTTPDSIWKQHGTTYATISEIFDFASWFIALLLIFRFLAWLLIKCEMSRRTRNTEISMTSSI